MTPVFSLPVSRRLPLLVLLMLMSAVARPAGAEYPWTESVPWTFLDQEPALHFLADQFEDWQTGWQVGSLGLAGARLSGYRNRVYLRWRYLSFSRDGRDALERWPDLSGTTAGAGWPGEDRSGGWGRPELGYLGRTRVPVAGALDYGLTAHLPFAKNELYPFAARSISLGFAARKSARLAPGLRLAVDGGVLRNLGAAGDELADAAFQAIRFWGLALDLDLKNGRRAGLDFRSSGSDNSSSRVLTAVFALPLGGEQELALGVSREFAAQEDRFYSTRLFLRLTVPLVPSGDGDTKDKGKTVPTGGRTGSTAPAATKESG